jgi:peptidoglycan/LPS O-acetylase OafA/YrhL
LQTIARNDVQHFGGKSVAVIAKRGLLTFLRWLEAAQVPERDYEDLIAERGPEVEDAFRLGLVRDGSFWASSDVVLTGRGERVLALNAGRSALQEVLIPASFVQLLLDRLRHRKRSPSARPADGPAAGEAAAKTTGRIRSLDSLRGIAALVVVFFHCTLLFPSVSHRSPLHGGAMDPWSWLLKTPLCLLVSGRASVLIFFVLSGLVLTFQFSRPSSLRAYYVKRVCRIWPPFAAAILFSAGLYCVVQPTPLPQFGAWFAQTWSHAPTLSVLLQHLSLIFGGDASLDNPIWSLTHEMRISIVFPLIVLAVRARPLLAIAGAIALEVAAAWVGPALGPIMGEIAHTASYAFLFVVGAAIGVRLPAVRALIARVPAWVRGGGWAVALFLVTLTPAADTAAGSRMHSLLLFAAGIGGSVVVALCTTENPVTRVLELPIPLWLGRVSYSLFLVHIPIIAALVHSFPNVSLAVIVPTIIVTSLVAAELLNRLVERPSEALGRYLAKPAAPRAFA